MRLLDNRLLHSASDLNAFLGCAHAAALNRQKLLVPESLPERAMDNDTAILLQVAGHAHDEPYLAQLMADGERADIPTAGAVEVNAAATADAMSAGVPTAYQAEFLAPPWQGFADFLRRVEAPSALGEWSHEVIDTLLARTASPKHVLQLALHSEQVAAVQGVQRSFMHLVLGDERKEPFRASEFACALGAAKQRYVAFIESGAEEPANAPKHFDDEHVEYAQYAIRMVPSIFWVGKQPWI
jgi:predicted RecB family nuclease